MVFFCCDKCGESLKKNQVQKHHYGCRSHSYSCFDCQKVFNIDSYADHLKCITENQKYGGKGYIEKVNKGEAKQTAWVDLVERATEAVKDPKLKNLLVSISGFANIPRKEAKFINFLVNSIRIRDQNLCQQAWNAIAEETNKIKVETTVVKETTSNGANLKEEIEGKETEATPTANGTNGDADDEENEAKTGNSTNSQAGSLKWKKAIKRKVRDAGGQIKLKKLRKAMHEDFMKAGDSEIDFDSTFDEKLQKAGVRIEGKIVLLTA
ncbi:unnamed protein product, partial [Mesorhabditis belari]|uniref:C2H2-type domain-containing protein n=1 Tax=Mesorhabditis belari TaxID=2138241 RepID=A0AAF3FGN5_9BILA